MCDYNITLKRIDGIIREEGQNVILLNKIVKIRTY